MIVESGLDCGALAISDNTAAHVCVHLAPWQERARLGFLELGKL